MIPPSVLAEGRKRAQEVATTEELVNSTAAVFIITIWLTLLALCIFWVYRRIER
jgi:hypothetical protein